MDEASLHSRISQIETLWTMLGQAHGRGADEARVAQTQLLQRYHQAILRYLRACLRDDEAAWDVFQDFALKFVNGDLAGADPARGRFRQYLKTTLARMAIDYRRRQARRGRQQAVEALELADAADAVDQYGAFEEDWGGELLEQTWQALQRHERDRGQPFYRVLRYRSEHPQASSAEMAAAMTQQLRPPRPYTDAGVRKTLQRAREKFAELLMEEVARSLQTDDMEVIEEELAALKLLSYCKSVLQHRKDQTRRHR